MGQLVPISGFDSRIGAEYDYVAFLPDELPDEVELDHQTWLRVSEAMNALGRLDQAGVLVPNPGLLRVPLLRREAVSTSALEGTHAAFADVLEADVVEDNSPTPEVREVLNYVMAAEYALAEVADGRPISPSLLADAQALLIRRTKDEGPETGRIRTTQVVIGPRDAPVSDARFIPPPPGHQLQGAMEVWSQWISHQRNLPILVDAALAHYQFETLHPFHEGNGRIGRLAVLLQLIQSGALREPLLEVSPWFEHRRDEYQDHMLAVSQTGNWNPWVRFFCTGIRDQALATVERVDKLLEFQSDIRSRLRSQKVRGVASAIAEELIGYPVVTVSWASRRHGVTFPAANSAIRRLVELKVLREATGRTYNRVFQSDAVYEILR